MTKSECGRLGGLKTLERHGVESMRERGKLGGRPRALTLSEIRQQRAQAAENIFNCKGGIRGKGNYKRANKKEGAAV